MMQATWHVFLVLAHLMLVAGLYTGERQPQWLAPPLTLGAAFTFALVSVYSSTVEVATQSGIETTSEPAIGIYALIGTAIALVLALVMTIRFLPQATGGTAYGN